MEELTAGLLFGDTMVMVGGGVAQTQGNGTRDHGHRDTELSAAPSPSSYSTGSSISSSCSPAYYNNNLLTQELFSEFHNDLAGFELATNGTGDGEDGPILQSASSDEDRTYMEELISSDLSSDEDKFLETIRYGGGGVVHFSNDLLSEEELVNTIQTYGDVKVVQVDGNAGVDGNPIDTARFVEVVHHVQEEHVADHDVKHVDVRAGGKKRKATVAANKPVKRTLQTMVSQPQASSKKHQHKQASQPRVFEDEIIIETNNGEVLSPSDLLGGSPSPGSPQQQTQDGTFQELKLSDEEKRLLMKEGISLPSHYPLTKLEERELKRIRRKIRNKISAQDSRKRKKEFLDRLQMKLQEVEDEKSCLQKRVRSLESINNKLNAQVKRLQQALSSATNSVTNGGHQQQKQTVVPAATTLLVLILSLALVVLPTSMDQRDNHHTDNGNEIISLLNRSNEMARDQGARVLGSDNKNMPKSRTLVGEEETDDDDMIDVKEFIGQVKTLLRNKRKRSNEVVGMVKRGRFDGMDRGGGLSGMKHGAGWWVSDEEDDEEHNLVANKIVKFMGGGGAGGRFAERKHAFHIVDELEVD